MPLSLISKLLKKLYKIRNKYILSSTLLNWPKSQIIFFIEKIPQPDLSKRTLAVWERHAGMQI